MVVDGDRGTMRMAAKGNLINAVLVQLFKHVPLLAARWAKRQQFVEGREIPWTPVRKPVAESTIALVTTAGVHLKSQEPFDMEDQHGDPSFRDIPADTPRADLMITHKYYDHSLADRDINVVLPLDRMRELAAERRIGGIAPRAYGFMGHIDGPHVTTLIERTAPEVARRLKTDGVDAAVLTPA
jgi:D-proline reductase (dithiol) PrdB